MLNFLTGLYERIPTFMTSYVPRIMHSILEAYTAEDQTVKLIEAREALVRAVTQNVSTEVCVESLSACWSNVEHKRKVRNTMTFLNVRRLRCSS